MTRIIMSGCTGKMGRVITAAVKEKADCKNDSKGAGTAPGQSLQRKI